MYFVCIRYLQDEDKAKDALQDSFIQAYQKIESYKNTGAFEGWLRRIVVNRCLKEIKKSQKLELLHQEKSQLENSFYEMEEDIDPDILRKILMDALDKLSKIHRTILNLSVVEQLSHKECADILGIKESSSRSQLVRAKQALKNILSEKNENHIISQYYER